jgi:hypothetical protein
LGNNAGRGEAQLFVVLDSLIGEDSPVPHLDIIGHVGKEEGGIVLGGGTMRAALVGGVTLGTRPSVGKGGRGPVAGYVM